MEEKNFYDILGVKKDATQDEIKKVYKELALKWHPDRFAGKSEKERAEAEEKFKEISEAYNVLSDEEKRKEYDMMGQDPFANGFDPFADFDPFGMHRRRQTKGEDITTKVYVTLEEVLYGTVKNVTYKRRVECDHCHGTGSDDGKDTQCTHCHGTGRIRTQRNMGGMMYINETICPYCGGRGKTITNPCRKCGGSGLLEKEETVSVNIPAGIFDGGTLTVQGMGYPPRDGNGINGDLYVTVFVLPHNKFTRDGDNIHSDLHLNLKEAWLGCEKEVETLDGKKLKIKIPKLTKDGQQFSLKGRGLANLKSGYITGSQIVTVVYDVPKSLTKKQEELLKEFYDE
jgi:molecular chaperone DnaJ